MAEHQRVNIRLTHPSFYRAVMTFGVFQIALAINFWYYTPTFNPKIFFVTPSKDLIGLIFFVIGVSQLLLLNVFRDLRSIRLAMTASIGWALFWGVANTQQAFIGKASLQLPIFVVFGLGIGQRWWLLESSVNPMTRRDS